MDETELKALEKEVKKRKRIATELASEVHDLVEDTLWTDYEQLPAKAERVYQACLAWAEAKSRLPA
ncbi:CCE_0567 family metalloprotein [Gynuella sp.]|uniref:CCE_0567 family metalloprotein n=1 Tax=Gynuella sp. TaxID=2969146 RepID=UPI003D0BC73C